MIKKIIIIETKKEEEKVLKKLEKLGYVWRSGHEPTMKSYFRKCSDTKYSLQLWKNNTITQGRLTASVMEFCNENTIKIQAKEFLRENNTIVIYQNGSETVALDKSTGKKATAKCSRDDTYDFYTGAKMAFERLTGEPKREFYNGKVVCIDNTYNIDLYTIGKVYEFKDGILTADDGCTYPSVNKSVCSFAEWEQFTCSKFIELVE